MPVARGCCAVVVVLSAFGLAACNKEEPKVASAPASAVPASAASAASGPLIAPVEDWKPTEAQRTAGATLASQGGGGQVAACSACHGAQGEGNAAAGYPRLAGQSHFYLAHELKSFANGTRNHPVMAPIAKAMNAEQWAAAAAYYASLAPAAAASAASAPAPSTPASGNAERGRQLAEVGDESKQVQSCANCHGPQGSGSGAGYPYLAGQHASYLANTLAAWRDGSRNDDPTGTMPVIAKALADADVQAAAAYYSQLPPPGQPMNAMMAAAAPASSAGSAVVSGPRNGSSSQAAQGTGSEQGAPVTGGGQGPGGGGANSGGGPTGSPTGQSTGGETKR